MNNGLPVSIIGTTKHYEGNGRQLGYPTANMATATNLVDGVYFGYADLAAYSHQPALIFVGTPVTVGAIDRRVEAHLLDVDDVDYYDLTLTLDIQYFHRPNQKLASLDALIEIMHQDESTARQWFAQQA